MRTLVSGYVNCKVLLLRIIGTRENLKRGGKTDGRGTGVDFTIMPQEREKMRESK